MSTNDMTWPPEIGIKPFYADKAVVIYNADCRDVVPRLPKCDLLLCDPPYGIGHPCNFKKRGRGNRCGKRHDGKPVWISPSGKDWPDVVGDNEPFDPSFLLALDVPAILWGANYFADKLPPSSGWLVWDKERPDDLDQSTCELAWTNCVKGVRRFRHLWNGMMRASEHGEGYHPTQKPVALMKWALLLKWTQDAQLILDPYAGSGPVGRAAKDLNRRAILVEISEDYCEIAASRMRQQVFEF